MGRGLSVLSLLGAARAHHRTKFFGVLPQIGQQAMPLLRSPRLAVAIVGSWQQLWFDLRDVVEQSSPAFLDCG